MSVIANGTQTTTIGVAHELHTTNTAGVYLLLFDTSNLANGDVLEATISVAFTSGGVHKQTHYSVFSHLQSDPGKVSVPVVAPYGATFFLKQTTGVSRSFDWCVTAG